MVAWRSEISLLMLKNISLVQRETSYPHVAMQCPLYAQTVLQLLLPFTFTFCTDVFYQVKPFYYSWLYIIVERPQKGLHSFFYKNRVFPAQSGVFLFYCPFEVEIFTWLVLDIEKSIHFDLNRFNCNLQIFNMQKFILEKSFSLGNIPHMFSEILVYSHIRRVCLRPYLVRFYKLFGCLVQLFEEFKR